MFHSEIIAWIDKVFLRTINLIYVVIICVKILYLCKNFVYMLLLGVITTFKWLKHTFKKKSSFIAQEYIFKTIRTIAMFTVQKFDDYLCMHCSNISFTYLILSLFWLMTFKSVVTIQKFAFNIIIYHTCTYFIRLISFNHYFCMASLYKMQSVLPNNRWPILIASCLSSSVNFSHFGHLWKLLANFGQTWYAWPLGQGLSRHMYLAKLILKFFLSLSPWTDYHRNSNSVGVIISQFTNDRFP